MQEAIYASARTTGSAMRKEYHIMARTLYDRANEIKTRHLSPQSVTGDKIANDAIEEKHIKDGVITRRKIADGMIGTDELANSAVTTAKLAEKSVTKEKIVDQSVANEKLADGSVTNAKIADDSISTAKIRDGAITQAKLSFTPPSVARPITPAVTTDEIANGAVTSIKIAANAIDGSKIVDGSITGAKIATNTITQGDIANNAIGTGEIQNGAVTPEKLSFTPVAPMSAITTVNPLNESSADDIDQIINLDAYIPAGANFALVQLRTSAGQLMASPTVSAVIWDDYVTEPIFLANLNQGMIEGSVVTQSGPARLYGPSAPSRAIRVAHIKNGQIAITQVYVYGYA